MELAHSHCLITAAVIIMVRIIIIVELALTLDPGSNN